MTAQPTPNSKKATKPSKPSLPNLDFPHIRIVERPSGGGYVIGGQGGLKPPKQQP